MIERSRDSEQSQIWSRNTDQMVSGEARIVGASVRKAATHGLVIGILCRKDDKLLRPCDVASQANQDEAHEQLIRFFCLYLHLFRPHHSGR